MLCGIGIGGGWGGGGGWLIDDISDWKKHCPSWVRTLPLTSKCLAYN